MKIVSKPWGHELIFATGHYIGKIIRINRGHRLSKQYHKEKHETIYVLLGRLDVVLKKETKTIGRGESLVIKPMTLHRFEANYGNVTLVEVSTPHPEDVVRLEDDYGRV